MTKPSTSPEIIAALRQFDSPTISNAVEHFEVRDPVEGYADGQLRCQFPQYDPMVGYAVTCTMDGTTLRDNRPLGLHRLLDAIQAAPKPAVLVIQDVGPDHLRSCFVGDMFSTALGKLGATGIVTDGGYRDRAGIEERTPGFQLFATGLVVSHGHNVIVDVGVTVTVCGLTIQPGDLLHGDQSGLLVIPQDITEGVLRQAEAHRRAEAEYFDFMEGEGVTFDELKRRLAPH